MHYTVVTASKSAGIGNGLTYQSQKAISIGSLVLVPLRNQLVEGIVIGQSIEETPYDVKKIENVLSNIPLLHRYQIDLLIYIAQYYSCTLRQALRVLLPSPPWSDLVPAKKIGYKLRKQAEVRGAKQTLVLEALRSGEWMDWDTLREETGASLQTIRSLVSQSILEQEHREETFGSLKKRTLQPLTLTHDQLRAHKVLQQSPKPTLLFGVTGSGKTEVYAQLILDVINNGKQALVLVPEILLTEHCIDRYKKLLGGSERIAVLHSRLTPAQRRITWKKIAYGDIDLVIGSRSAVFAPIKKLGLIIIDEEHEWTYKNEQTPRYHARTLCQQIAKKTGAMLVLGSATPSLESWHATVTGRFQIARLPQRYKNQPMPNVRIIDLADVEFANYYPFSPTLIDAIYNRIEKQEQSVLFLNRRGSFTALLCLECRRRVISPESQLPFTVHHGHNGLPYLMDHTTGTTVELPAACPHCQSKNLRTIGAGTQGVERTLKQLFPKIRLLRMDADSMNKPSDMRRMLEQMKNGEADILLGTQSVVKGLDFPNVTLSAVLLADVGLSLPDFRAGERVFQLLTQLIGRSGRAKPGEVIIQSFRPNSAEIHLAATHHTEEYLTQECKLRSHGGYPPFASMIRLLIRGPDAKQRTTLLHAQLQKSNCAVSYGPTLFGGGKEWQVLLRGENLMNALEDIDLTEVVVDRDPVECV